ncbi:hypothetical protein GCM10010123_15890 [Pilimelia anulata]|uniref:Uncharacterized protein n=1 Tax=Pilimelia anulata TaxID=53371 RepID=A0A8J3B1E3_9ACTN|nr:hypothetical protein [Pilimelia anulata]GGJ87145.1 hypothetical protein GCM10010123_15890 [Pilimelia anulata]
MEPHVTSALRNGPFHHALRTAIKSRGLPLERLRQRLTEAGAPVGIATLSSWQSGRRRPERPESLRAVELLEGILGLPPRALVILLGAPRRRGPGARAAAEARRFADLLELAGPVTALTDQLGSRDGRLRTLSAWDFAEIGLHSSLTSVESVVVLEAVEEVDRYVTVYNGVPGTDLQKTVRFHALANCRLGRVRHDVEHGLVVAELLFDRRLYPGETAIARYRVEDSSGRSDTEYSRFLRFQAQHVAVEVRFAPDALPIRCWRFLRQREGQPDQMREEVTLGAHRDAHVVRNAVPPGIIGIAWEPSDAAPARP